MLIAGLVWLWLQTGGSSLVAAPRVSRRRARSPGGQASGAAPPGSSAQAQQLQCAAFLASLPVGSSRMRDQPRCLPRWQAGSLPLSRRGDTLCALLSRSVLSDSLSEWTVPRQAPLSVGFSRQEHWSGLPCPPPGDLPNPGI